MRDWIAMLGGLIVWAAHFFTVYGIASLFPGTALAKWLTIIATIAALAVAAWWLKHSLADQRSAKGLRRWMAGVAATGSGTAIIGILYQGLPALLI